MKGGSLAMIRQGYGFTIYTSLISEINGALDQFSHINKYYRYSFAAFVSKWAAMTFEAPLTLLKTRMEVINSNSLTK